MASDSILPPIPGDIAFMTGPPLLGIMLNWCLLGILIVQVYIYYLCFHDDKKGLKILVYTLFCLELIQTGLTTADAFHWFAYGFGNMTTLATTYISPIDAPIMNSMMAYVVQLFFGWRLWVLSKSRILCISIALVGGVQLGGGLATGVIALRDNAITPAMLAPLTVWLAGSALVDTIIAAAMTYYLLRARRNVLSVNRNTNDIILRLVRLTIETNAASAGVAIVTLGAFIASPRSNLSFCPSYVLGKIYTNTLMVALNNRIFLSRNRGAVFLAGSDFEADSSERPATSNNSKDSRRLEVYRETIVTTDIRLDNLEGPEAKRSMAGPSSPDNR